MTIERRLLPGKVLTMNSVCGTVAAYARQALHDSGLLGPNQLRIMQSFDVDTMCDTENSNEQKGS